MLVVLILLLAGPIIVTGVFIVEIIVGLARRPTTDQCETSVRAVVVMPAHDEAAIVETTLATLMPQLVGWARLVLVADNCSDATEGLARKAGAEVIVRSSTTDRGKGFALAFAQAHLRNAPVETVIVLDADCASDRASLIALAIAARENERPCQAVNLIRPDLSASPMVQLSSFAFMIKNLVRQRGLQRLAGQVHLTGTGMAFPWALFESAPLASDNIVEDVELGHAMARRGYPPMLVSAATVWSDAAGAAGTLVQRRRWEGGFIALARKEAPRALAQATRELSPRSFFAALDLCVPPLTVLAIIDGAALLIAFLLTWSSGTAYWPLGLEIIICGVALSCVFVAWAREGRKFIHLRALLRIPLYVLWKIPIYLGIVRGKPAGWVQADR